MRGIPGTLYETSKLNASEGIAYRGTPFIDTRAKVNMQNGINAKKKAITAALEVFGDATFAPETEFAARLAELSLNSIDRSSVQGFELTTYGLLLPPWLPLLALL